MNNPNDPEPTQEVKETAPVEAPQIPEDTSERTKEQFTKLSSSNKELKKENDEVKKERDNYKNVLESLRPNPEPKPAVPSPQNYPNLSQGEIDNIAQGLVDQNGYVDMSRLDAILRETSNRAVRAEKAALAAQQESQKTVRDFEESAKMREVHKAYPELDPKSDNFNEDFFDAVRNELVGQMLKGQKEDVDVAAEKWHKRMFGKKETESKEDKAKREQGQEARAVINTTPSASSTRNRTTATDQTDLVQRTRLGDRSALKERLERSGY